MPIQTQKLFDRIERSHKDILDRIDRLDQQIAEVLLNWTQGGHPNGIAPEGNLTSQDTLKDTPTAPGSIPIPPAGDDQK